jgi:hypothetical protein
VWEQGSRFRVVQTRLNHANTNPVKHGLVRNAENYRWYAANWFAQRADRTFYSTVMQLTFDKIEVPEEFDVLAAPAVELAVRRGNRYAAKAGAGLPHSKLSAEPALREDLAIGREAYSICE